jgi:hypothetical protein
LRSIETERDGDVGRKPRQPALLILDAVPRNAGARR